MVSAGPSKLGRTGPLLRIPLFFFFFFSFFSLAVFLLTSQLQNRQGIFRGIWSSLLMNSQRFDTNTHTRLQFDLQSFVVSFGFEQKQAECPPIQMEPVDLSVSGRGSSGGRGGHVVLTDTRRRSSRSPESRKRRSSPANGIDLRVNKAGTSLPPNLHCAVLFKAVHIATLIALQEGATYFILLLLKTKKKKKMYEGNRCHWLPRSLISWGLLFSMSFCSFPLYIFVFFSSLFSPLDNTCCLWLSFFVSPTFSMTPSVQSVPTSTIS